MKKTLLVSAVMGGILLLQSGTGFTASNPAKLKEYAEQVQANVASAPEPTTHPSAELIKEAGTAETLDDMTKDLLSLGILADPDDLRLDDTLTRAEAAKLLVYASSSEDIKPAEEKPDYNDVAVDHWAYYVIHAATVCEYIDGSDGMFRPEDTVTLSEWAKMLVCAVGYNIYADNMGGYPNGYMMQAGTLGITEGVSGANDLILTRGEAFRMLYNTMDIPLLSYNASAETYNYQIMDGIGGIPYKTLRTYHNQQHN